MSVSHNIQNTFWQQMNELQTSAVLFSALQNQRVTEFILNTSKDSFFVKPSICIVFPKYHKFGLLHDDLFLSNCF